MRKHPALYTVPVFSDPEYFEEPLSKWGRDQIAVLRQEEKDKDLFNSVGDWAVYQFQSIEDVTNAVKSRLYKDGIERFRDRLPADMIRRLIDATINREHCFREELRAYRAEEERKKAARSAKRQAMLSLVTSRLEGERHVPGRE